MDQIVSATIEIAQGKLQGLARDGVLRFNGVPFAKPPVGALRWRMPEAPEPWSGVRDASRFANIAPQVESTSGAVLGGTPGTRDEDCLYLNIQTPACDGAKRAVMVWIHGGGFVTGAGSVGTYNGKYIVPRGDIVLVTINYRLGAFGFLN
jgi:para-nitrobenzyl esterase